MMRPVISLGAIVLLISIFLYLGAPVFFGEFADMASRIILAYTVILLTVIIGFRAQMPTISISPKSLILFIALFGITFVILSGSNALLFTSSFEPLGYVSFGFLYGFVKAFIEEIVFRWVIPAAMAFTLRAEIIASALFGLFHFGALSVTGAALPTAIVGMVFLGVLGFIWSQIRNIPGRGNPDGLMGAVGSHFGYNTFVLGG